MRALVCKKLGNPLEDDSVLSVVHDQASPTLADHQVRIKVAAAALNFADVLQVQGLYQEKANPPFIPCGEVSGHIIDIGKKVRSLKKGDVVCAVTLANGAAEEVVVGEQQVLKLNNVKDLQAAAGLPIAFGTSHLAICERANLQAGQTILILGAAGGVGMAAVQIAKVKGAKVIAVARGQAKTEALKKIGADIVIDSSNIDVQLRQLIKKAAPKGVDVLYDPVGGKQHEEALKCVKWGGHILIIGFASGPIPKIAANIALVKNWTVHGIYWGSYLQHQPKILQKGLQEIAGWFSEEKISVLCDYRCSLENAKEGFAALMNRKAVGKVLLIPNATVSKL